MSQQHEDRSSGRAVQRIDHVGMIVEDADVAAATFRNDFALEVEEDWIEPSGHFRLVYLDTGETTLQLVQPLREGPLMAYLAEHGEGLHHVCFAVDDLDRTVATSRGGPAAPPYVGGRGVRVCFLRERRHGTLIELTEA